MERLFSMGGKGENTNIKPEWVKYHRQNKPKWKSLKYKREKHPFFNEEKTG